MGSIKYLDFWYLGASIKKLFAVSEDRATLRSADAAVCGKGGFPLFCSDSDYCRFRFSYENMKT